jgi:DNA modification methylase
MIHNRILLGDNRETLKTLPDRSVDCCVTSPPYYLMRNYGNIEGQIGLESTPEEYVGNLVGVFREVWRVLKDTGTLWVVIGDSYAGSRKGGQGKYKYMDKEIPRAVFFDERLPPKSLIGIPWRFALAMQPDWLLRQDIIWAKQNPMPESQKDRFCRSHEHIFFFAKQPDYYFDQKHALEESILYRRQNEAVRKRGYSTKPNETGFRPQNHGANIEQTPYRTMRDVWFVATEVSRENHYAIFPKSLIAPCILCGCPERGTVLDPFMGSGTTGVVARSLSRKYIGCEINPDYVKSAERRVESEKGDLG